MLGERIKCARLSAGLTLRELAEKVGVSHTAILKYEKNEDIPNSTVLIKLADVLGINVEYFFRDVNINLGVYAYRKKKKLSKKSEEIVINRIKDWLERYIEIENIINIKTNKFEFPDNINRNVAVVEDIEKLAEDLRAEWNLGMDPIENLTELMEEKGLKIGLVEGLDDFDSCIIVSEQTGPIIAVKKNLPGDRQRFDVAHEIGHLFIKPEGNMDIEKAAHRFAGAFLVPREAAIEELGKKRNHINLYELHLLKHKYGLSMQEWIYRAKDLKIISEQTAKKLFTLFRRNGWYVTEPGDPYPQEEPRRFERLILRALSEGIINETRAAEIIGQPLKNFWDKAGMEHQWKVSL